VVAQYDPAEHDEQLEELTIAWKYPTRQLEQTVEEAAEYLPAAQSVHAPYKPEVPAWQVQPIDPVLPENIFVVTVPERIVQHNFMLKAVAC